MNGNKKISINLTVDEWYDLTDCIYCYASEMKYQYGEYLKKGMAKQDLGEFVCKTEEMAKMIDSKVEKQLKREKQENGKGFN
jgi:hypothetical protein